MLVGFVFWYRGLALASLVLHEPISLPMLAAALPVGLCVVGARRFATSGRIGV